METFEIWSEGYTDNGGRTGAIYFGSVEGKDFKDACKSLCERNVGFSQYFDEEHMTWWGCSLFSNSKDATTATIMRSKYEEHN